MEKHEPGIFKFIGMFAAMLIVAVLFYGGLIYLAVRMVKLAWGN